LLLSAIFSVEVIFLFSYSFSISGTEPVRP